MKQIETLVFDYGGVIVNIDDASVVKAMESLGVTAFKRLIHVRKIKRLMHQYINGLVAEAETLKEHQARLHYRERRHRQPLYARRPPFEVS